MLDLRILDCMAYYLQWTGIMLLAILFTLLRPHLFSVGEAASLTDVSLLASPSLFPHHIDSFSSLVQIIKLLEKRVKED